jgi:transposase
MRAETPPTLQPAATGAEPATILVSFELSQSNWVLTVRSPAGEKLSRHGVKAADTARALLVLDTHRTRAERKLGAAVRIIAIQEAGLDGFWVHRWLEANGVESHVVDAASIAAPRRKRRAKSDGIDGETLLRVLAAWLRGEPRVCSMVVPPGVEDEDRRRLSRERDELLRERTALTNRIRGLLASQGVRGYQPLKQGRHQALEALRTGDGRALPGHLKAELRRMLDRVEVLLAQIKAVEAERDALLAEDAAEPPGGSGGIAAMLTKLRAIGPEFTSVLLGECFWRSFGNRRQLAAFAGLAPTPWRSGGIEREQGISGGGNPRLRKTVIEMAWLWLRHQPGSALSQWFQARAGTATGRVRRIAVVALARKLLVALWRYVTDGVVPEGAVFKPV